MAGHAPYIMPDGRSLHHYMKLEQQGPSKKKKQETRGKDELWKQLVAQRARLSGGSAEHELAELKAFEAAGVRTRRRWLNEKTLRDLAGPLTSTDMEAQFKPAPFGFTNHISPLTQAMQPENAAIWDLFRNIDSEKEAKVLQKWAEHQKDQLGTGPAQSGSPAAVALHCWGRVGKKARQALKRANPHSVLQLELQITTYLEQGQQQEQLVLSLEDGFARLLVHGLADFYNLLSCSKILNSVTCVVVYHRQGSTAQPP